MKNEEIKHLSETEANEARKIINDAIEENVSAEEFFRRFDAFRSRINLQILSQNDNIDN